MSKVPQNAKGSATAPTVPSHDPISSDPGDDVNGKIHITAHAEKEPTPGEHQHSEAVVLAAQWLADELQPPQPIIPALRQRFDLTALEATESCALAKRYRTFRRAQR